MPGYCIVCRREFIPNDGRTFHRFPSDQAMKQKWMEAIGRTNVSKSTTVCSDHFDARCFHQNEYSTIRRLVKDAVPFAGGTEAPSPELPIMEITSSPERTSSCGDPVPDESSKVAGSDGTANERCRFKVGFRYVSISREDFATDESWNKFLLYRDLNKRRLHALKQRNVRKNKKFRCMNDVIATLRENEADAAARYLEGLPEHLKELIVRIKDRKHRSAFPPELRSFACSLHRCSPTAYEMVRRSFLKCLPQADTVKKWRRTENPEIIGRIVRIIKT